MKDLEMKDLIERLRALARCEHSDDSVAEEAAAALEAAREDAERWRALREMDGGEIYALLGDCDGIHPEQADAAIDRARGKGIETGAPFSPDWASPPGDTIADVLEERGWTQAELARRLGYTEEHVSQLINGKAPITEDTASRLERVLGSTAGFWLRKEATYRERLERQQFAQQPAAVDGRHCATCTCNPNMTPSVRFDLSPAQMEGAIREHLIRLGWTPPKHRQYDPYGSLSEYGIFPECDAQPPADDEFMTLKRFIELELAKIEPQWTAEGKGSYWWGVKIGLETVLAKLCEMDGTVMVNAPRPNTASEGECNG